MVRIALFLFNSIISCVVFFRGLTSQFALLTCFDRYTVYKDHIRLVDYEIHDGMGLELYYM